MFCLPEELNDATSHYVSILRRGLGEAGYDDLGITRDGNILRSAGVAITISALQAVRAKIIHPRVSLVHWFQGIEAVERRFLHGGWRGLGRYVLWSAMEAFLLRRARLKLFVSVQMREHLGDLRLRRGRSLVIPCYNSQFDGSAFDRLGRYGRLDLVYAGSLYPWQCVEDTLQVFRALQHRRPEARLTILTRQTAAARAMCDRLDLRGVDVHSVEPAAMGDVLKQFSFGFILRQDMPINQVSTPTKFSSYLGAGVIPVLSRATPSLVRMLDECPYAVVVGSPSDHEGIARRIEDLAREQPAEASVRDAYRRIFERHFDDALHAGRVATLAREL